MILRPSYIEAIAPFIDQPLVKILAGVRRCGKSTIFEMLADELRRRGVPEDRIIKKRYTEMDIPADISAKDMYDDLKLQIQGKGRCYLLLDEIQEVKGWEKTVNSLLEGADVDIYVTGSNSKLMSSEISTYLTGRYVSIPVYPLSFREFLDFKAGDPRPPKELLEDFIRFGGFPIIALGRYDTQSAYQIVNGIYHKRLPDRRWHLSHSCLPGYCQTAPDQQAGSVRPGSEVFDGKHGQNLLGQLHHQVPAQ